MGKLLGSNALRMYVLFLDYFQRSLILWMWMLFNSLEWIKLIACISCLMRHKSNTTFNMSFHLAVSHCQHDEDSLGSHAFHTFFLGFLKLSLGDP